MRVRGRAHARIFSRIRGGAYARARGREDFYAYVRGRGSTRDFYAYVRAFIFFRVRVGRESRTSHHQEEIFGIKSGKNYPRVCACARAYAKL